jgi:hypothetical protein
MKTGLKSFSHFLQTASAQFLKICYFISNFQKACSNPTSELKAHTSPIVSERMKSIKAVNIPNSYHL